MGDPVLDTILEIAVRRSCSPNPAEQRQLDGVVEDYFHTLDPRVAERRRKQYNFMIEGSYQQH